MSAQRPILTRAAPALLLAAATVVLACTDRANPVAPVAGPGPREPGTPARPIELAELRCTASRADLTVECVVPTPAGNGQGDILYGGQNTYVVVKSSNVDYNSGTNKFTFNVTVRNLIAQAIGTTNGTSADPSGVKVFFDQQPTTLTGTGEITIDNADGIGTFTASGQPYYAYVQKLDQFQVSSAKTWQFDMPPTVGTFGFTLFISSPVQFPVGWIEVSHPTYSLRRTYEKGFTGIVHNQYGKVIEGAVITWSSANPAIATIDPGTGLAHGHLPGTVNLVASSTNDVNGTVAAVQTGAVQATIFGTQLVWTAGATNTNWNDPANWDRNVAPVAQDSATIPVVGSGIYPVLVQNQSIGRLVIDNTASMNLQSFDLTASQDVYASSTLSTGGITGTVGRVILTGSAKLTHGIMPRIRVNSGTYSLDGNINAKAPLRVDLGRIRNQGFRLRVVSQ
ncbi:MAG TPA: hypothetical protein VEX86_24280 [Longimicrobium sp.]|nr:hypothetical protein [Longimicrobium sp.]